MEHEQLVWFFELLLHCCCSTVDFHSAASTATALRRMTNEQILVFFCQLPPRSPNDYFKYHFTHTKENLKNWIEIKLSKNLYSFTVCELQQLVFLARQVLPPIFLYAIFRALSLRREQVASIHSSQEMVSYICFAKELYIIEIKIVFFTSTKQLFFLQK